MHSDAASSEGRELSAYVLGHRAEVEPGQASKIKNLLLDLRWAMDKTSATRAKDFRSSLQEVAELCTACGAVGHSWKWCEAADGEERLSRGATCMTCGQRGHLDCDDGPRPRTHAPQCAARGSRAARETRRPR